MKQYFALIYQRGSNWVEGNWDSQQLRPHGEYISKLFKEGKVVLGGPFDGKGAGMTIIDVETREEAEKIVEEDPAVQAGIFDAMIYPYLIAFERE